MSANLNLTSDVSRSVHAADAPRFSKPSRAESRNAEALRAASNDRQDQQKTRAEEAKADVKRNQPQEETLSAITEQLNDVMTAFNKGLRFEVNEKIDALYVKIINKSTDEVIKTIPSEEVLRMMERMHSALGMILDTEV